MAIGVENEPIKLKTKNRDPQGEDYLVEEQNWKRNKQFTIPANHMAIATWWVPTGNIDELGNFSYIQVTLVPNFNGPSVNVEISAGLKPGKEAFITIRIYVMHQHQPA